MKVKELMEEIHAVACSKGWWDEPQDHPTQIALIHSELSEALQTLRSTHDDALCSKCGGTGLTALSVALRCAYEHLPGQQALAMRIAQELEGCKQLNLPFSEFFTEECSKCEGSGEAIGGSQLAEEYADVVIRIFDLCEGFNIDLPRAIQEKMKYNAKREYKHGKTF